uniref:RING-type domain-containing protein n=2 Tax=Araucaria cunninghamii TaxID=56994 RepID=A0A0D6QZ43_ARACU
MASQHWKFRQHWDGSFHFDPQAQEASSSDSDTCASSHASGWEAASSSAPSPNRTRQINRHHRRDSSNPWRGSVRRGGGRVFFAWDSSSSSGAEETMTSTSELLYQRRSRVGRSTEVTLPEAASRRLRSSSSSAHSNRFHRSNHYDPNYHHYYHCHRSLRMRNPLQQVPEGDDQSQFSEHTSTSSMHNDDTGHGQSRLMGTFFEQAAENNSLRGAVMQARERLYQRFRASSLISNRHNTASTITDSQYPFREDPMLSNRWVTEVGWNRLASRNGQFEEELEVEFSLPREPKPQGLNQKGISNLQREVFAPTSTTENKGSKEVNSVLEQEDCPVCLEHFSPGEQLIRLACRHRFHPVCLTPWLKICGDCPYCRAIVVQDHGSSIGKSSSGGSVGL